MTDGTIKKQISNILSDYLDVAIENDEDRQQMT